LTDKVKAQEVFLKKGHKHRKKMNCKQNGEIIIEVEIKMCLTVQNISNISAKHFPWARVESGLSSFFWE